jgi:hypothetical protein
VHEYPEDALMSVINSSRRAANIKFKKENEKPNKISSPSTYQKGWFGGIANWMM